MRRRRFSNETPQPSFGLSRATAHRGDSPAPARLRQTRRTECLPAFLVLCEVEFNHSSDGERSRAVVQNIPNVYEYSSSHPFLDEEPVTPIGIPLHDLAIGPTVPCASRFAHRYGEIRTLFIEKTLDSILRAVFRMIGDETIPGVFTEEIEKEEPYCLPPCIGKFKTEEAAQCLNTDSSISGVTSNIDST